MKYTIKRYIKGVRGVKIHLSFEIIGYKNRELFVNQSKISENVDTTSASLKIVNNFLFFDKNGSAYCFDLLNNQLFETNKYRAYEHSLKDETFVCIYDEIYDNTNNTFTWCTGLFNFKNQKLITEYKFLKNISIAHFLNQEFVITYLKPIGLGKISLLTGEYEWEVDLGGRQYLNAANEPMEAEIQQIIGVWENQLLVSLSNQNLIGIDINKGTILWEKCPWSLYPSLSGGLANPILEKDSVFWYSYGAYFEFHLPSLTGKLLKEYPHTDKTMPPFAIKQTIFTEKYIYFIASQKSFILNNIIGVFNRETLQIDWQEEMDILPKKSSDPYNSLLQIQATEDKIYVLDSEGILYIFQRENF